MIRIVVPGPPPRKNERHRIVRISGHGRMKNSDKYESFCMRLLAQTTGKVRIITSGLWIMDVESYWPRRAKLPEGGWVPNGDFDAPLSSIADALEVAGVIDNDKRIMSGWTSKHYDKNSPRVEITLQQVIHHE